MNRAHEGRIPLERVHSTPAYNVRRHIFSHYIEIVLNPSDIEVELKFSRESDRAAFPAFCNSLIALEAPRTKSFPVLTTKAGPDGGIDGEWDLTGTDGFVPVSVAGPGWNVYQFKTVDVLGLGEQKALIDLTRSVRGAVADLLSRQVESRILGKYVLFTNLRLGPESEATTANGALLNSKRVNLRDEILKGAAPDLDVAIIDAGQISGFIVRHPSLRIGWFSPGQGTAWNEMRRRERRNSAVDVPLIGRDTELANLEGWLGDPDVRVIAVSGPNSVGKTRLVIEATQPSAPITFFAEDVHALVQEGVRAYATAERTVVLVVEDPPIDLAKRLAEQAAGCEKPIKLIVTLPSPEYAPVVRLGDDARVKPCPVPRLLKDAAAKLVECVNSSLESRLRDWIVQQADGIPGVLVAAARLGEELHRDSISLRKQLSQKLRHSLESKVGKGALPLLQALSPLVYVRVSGQSPELPVLLARIAPEIDIASAIRQLPELTEFGFVRKQGEYVAVVPPMFAAGLFYDVVQSNPALPGQLLQDLDLAARKRLLERLVTLELTDETPYASLLFGQFGPLGDTARLSENLGLLDYLARALPYATARFLLQSLDLIWSDVVHLGQNGMEHLLTAVNELLDEPETTATAFTILKELATREALESDATEAAKDFSECFVYWYPRSISYPEREAALEPMLASSDLALRLLGLKAITTATNPPDSLSGRSVTVRRIGSKPRYGTWKDCWDFLLRMVNRRLALCFDSDAAIRNAALEELPATISRLSGHLPIEDEMVVVREISEPFFKGILPVDPVKLHDNVKWTRDFYERSSKDSGQKEWQDSFAVTIAELDTLLARLEDGTLDHRLRLAIGRSSGYDEVVFEGRNYYEHQVPILQLAREVAKKPSLMNEAAWNVLGDKEAVNRHEFAIFLGEHDEQHHFFPELLVRASVWPWSHLLGAYLSTAIKSAPLWVEEMLDEMLVSPSAPKNALLIAICAIGPTETNRARLVQMLSARVLTADEVANAFSVGRWLQELPTEEVRAVLTFILSEPDHEAAMFRVTSLYLHHARPLPRELFDVVKPSLYAPIRAHTRETYELDQVATGFARTDLELALDLLRESVRRLSDVNSRGSWTGWNPFEVYGTRDFWDYLRTQSPERAYGILGEWNIESRGPERIRIGNERHLLDLKSHQKVLTDLARTNRNAARIFASCAHSDQPSFFPFAYDLVEIYPNDDRVVGALNSALIKTSGFGHEYDWHTSAIQTVNAELNESELSPAAHRWLESLHALLLRRRGESRRDFGSSEPSFLD
jgi:hypothetical protein